MKMDAEHLLNPEVPLVTLDFETKPIGPRPDQYPPKPVGVALDYPAAYGTPTYHAWGHPSENNFSARPEDQKNLISGALTKGDAVIMHNAAFDSAVLEEHYGIKVPRKHCTMVLAFLSSPYGELRLKPLAEQKLGLPPDEQQEVKNYINNVIGKKGKDWGAYICDAPGALVGKYAQGDVLRTRPLFDILIKDVIDRGMLPAYEREMRLMPAISDMASRGVHVDLPRLQHDTNLYFARLEDLDEQIQSILGECDVDKDAEVAERILAAGLCPNGLPKTAKGATQVNKDALMGYCSHKQLVGMLMLRNSIATSVRTFMAPWLLSARKHNGKIWFEWNQVRNYSDTGARTGRMSSSPNAQNIPSKWEKLAAQLEKLEYEPPYMPPDVRSYIIAPPGKKLIGLDYSQQEIRLLAHFADGILMREYCKNPNMDPHTLAAELAKVPRKVAKTIAFSSIYGAGLDKIADQIGCTRYEAQIFKALYFNAMPDIEIIIKKCQARGKAGLPITTLGGRQYYAEPPKIIEGRRRTFEYKLTNYLIQGSAADQTKEAMLNYWDLQPGYERHGDMIIQVHDQLVAEVDEQHAESELAVLQKCMQEAFQDLLDVPFVVDGAIGNNFSEV